MFIARISRGRTLREFVFGVLLMPTLFNFVYIAALGGTAIEMELAGKNGIAGAVQQDVTVALYRTLEVLAPLEWLGVAASAVATLLIAVYFITSADSGTLVINTIMSSGNPHPPMVHRVIWGLGIGFLTAVLVVAGGVGTLQDAVIAAALPFSFVLIVMTWGMVQGLREERVAPRPGRKQRLSAEPWTGADTDAEL